MTASKNIIERSPFPMAATEGPTHSLRYVSASFCALHGMEVYEVLGHPIAEAIPRSISASLLNLLDRVYLGAESGTVNSLYFSNLERRVGGQTYTAWSLPASDELAKGLVIQVSDSSEEILADQSSE